MSLSTIFCSESAFLQSIELEQMFWDNLCHILSNNPDLEDLYQ